MNATGLTILKGAVGGLLAAAAIDAHAWQASGIKGFDWNLAAGRWLAGALIGAATAFTTSA